MYYYNENRPAEDRLRIEHLTRCLLYAREAMRDPVKRQYYHRLAKRLQTAFNVAFIDAYYFPKIIGIVLDYFCGRKGNSDRSDLLPGIYAEAHNH
jgi:hypothetical protein